MVCIYCSRETLRLITFRVKVTALKGFVVQALENTLTSNIKEKLLL